MHLQQFQFDPATHKMMIAAKSGDAIRLVLRSRYGPGLYWLVIPFQFMGATTVEIESRFNEVHRGFSDNHCPRLGDVLKSRREVRRFACHCVGV